MRYPKVIAYIMTQRGEKVSEIIFKTIIGKGGKGEKGEQGVSYEVPTNSIVAYDGSDLPAGWIECDAPEGFPAIARALGGVGKAGVTSITEAEYRTAEIAPLNNAQTTAEQIASLLGASVASMPPTGSYTDCFLLYMTPRDLEYKTGVAICGYQTQTYYQTSIYRYVNGELKTQGIYNGSLTKLYLDFIIGTDSWICGTRQSLSSNLDIRFAYSKGKHLDDPTIETGVYAALIGSDIYNWCELFDQPTEPKQLISIPTSDSVSLAPIVSETARVKANNLYVIMAMKSLSMGNKAWEFTIDGDTYNTVSSVQPTYRRLAIIKEGAQA